jgi:hypothetical protein
MAPTTSSSRHLDGLPFSLEREVVVPGTVHEAPVGQN